MSCQVNRLRQLRSQGGSFSLGGRARVLLEGSDRLRYLNGQVSNDLNKLTPGRAMSALLLNAKGKLCAHVFVWAEGDGLIVEADAGTGENLLARLERYAVADDVTFAEMLPRKCDHVFGTFAAGLDGMAIERLGVDGVDLTEAPVDLIRATEDEVTLLRIERGIPRWGAELSEETLPQEAGLERHAVDFNKGCYVGQEVVSRLQSVGHANRRLCGFVGDFPAVSAGSAILTDDGGKKTGTLCSAAFHPDLEKTVALGYLATRSKEESFSVWDESGACLGRAERSEFPLFS